MIKSARTVTLISALLFSMGAMAQTGGGSGNPTQNMGKDNPTMAQPGGSSEPDASTTHTTKHKATKHKKASGKDTMGKTSDGSSDGPGK